MSELKHSAQSLLDNLDGFRVGIDPARERADIILNRGPFNIISMLQREQLRLVFEALDENEADFRYPLLRRSGAPHSGSFHGNGAGHLYRDAARTGRWLA